MNVKKGDKVIVISGRDKGKSGTVDRAFPQLNRVLVSGINIRKKHQKPRKTGEKGQTIEKAMPIHSSNVMILEGGKKVRTSKKIVDGKKIRVSRKTGKAI